MVDDFIDFLHKGAICKMLRVHDFNKTLFICEKSIPSDHFSPIRKTFFLYFAASNNFSSISGSKYAVAIRLVCFLVKRSIKLSFLPINPYFFAFTNKVVCNFVNFREVLKIFIYNFLNNNCVPRNCDPVCALTDVCNS